MKSLHTITRKFFLFLALVLSGTLSLAQVKVGDNPTTINANAVLDVESATRGILFPRMSLIATTDPSPLTLHIAGMQVYNTNTGLDVDPGIYYNDGTKWLRAGVDADRSIVYGEGVPTGTCTSGTLYADTLETSPTVGQTWTCVNSAWVTYNAPDANSTPFYLGGTTRDAAGNKNGSIYRTGRIGIGTKSPRGSLHVVGSIMAGNPSVTGNIWSGTANRNEVYIVGSASDAYLAVHRSGDDANFMLSKRSAVINSIFQSFYVNGTRIGTIVRNSSASINYNTTSDVRLKENIKLTHYGIQDLMKIGVKDYNYISDKAKTRTTGFIAQELYKIFPEAVTVGGKDANKDPWSVDYAKVTPLLVKAIQEQQAEIEALKAQLSERNAFNAQEVASLRDLIKAQSSPVIPSR